MNRHRYMCLDAPAVYFTPNAICASQHCLGRLERPGAWRRCSPLGGVSCARMLKQCSGGVDLRLSGGTVTVDAKTCHRTRLC